jgi:16S rRNA processing protein RimM
MRLVVARIGRAHGIRGEVTVEVHTDVPEERFVPGAVLPVSAPAGFVGAPVTLTVRAVRDHNGTLLLAFDGVRDRTAAEGLRGLVLEADVPPEVGDPDAWYDHQLIGLAAVTPGGAELGTVVGVEHSSAQDLLVVQGRDGRQRLVPFVTAIVPTVDPVAGLVVIDPPAGLLDGPELR